MPVINRRQFLVSLAALGAAIVLPADAASAQVNKAWEQMLRNPWFFEVNDSGTIVEPDGQEPRIRSDVYESISLAYLNTPDDLIAEIDQYVELRGHVVSLAADELEEVESLIEEGAAGLARKRLLALQAALQDPDDGWQAWVRLEGVTGLPRFKRVLEDWLAEPVDWSQMELWPRGWGGQGKALTFFEQLARDIRDELDIVIVEGDHPGSSYFVAELRGPIPDANEAAQRLGLPFRFREEPA